jgi:ElaB/YqjD/DUF883 family membrane-anchored ribosome-binding protein
MGQDPGAVSASKVEREDGPGRDDAAQPPQDPQQLRDDIERTREDLGDTVAALAEKTDVKARAKEKVTEVRGKVDEKRAQLTGGSGSGSGSGGPSAVDQVREKAQDNPVATAALAAFVGGLVFGRLTKRR